MTVGAKRAKDNVRALSRGEKRLRELRQRLDALVEQTRSSADRLHADPVAFVHRYEDPRDRELVGLLASGLAFGNVVAVRASIARVLDVLGPSPARSVREMGGRRLAGRLRAFVHRVYRGSDVAILLDRAAALQASEGSLGEAFAARFAAADSDLREGLSIFADALRGPSAARGLAHLLPDPRAGSACKRLLLYLRWMIRPADGVDLGLWSIAPARLIIPVDTHVHRIAKNLGLTSRNDASWRTAEEITAILRTFDPADPVKYDFALCHLGVSRDCPSRADPEKCARCVLRPVCVRWRSTL